ncbi:MAG: RIP metalloprotease RseP [Bacteroidales bacterium]|nr:RIP metalloprotease RseP [Bacteroidales bacterium]
MNAVLIKVLQVILALSVLILFHELGHFSFAKLFGIRVDKFFLFFDAGGVKLLSTKTGWFARLFPGLKKHETEYGIGWLPLGGYCKIAGMIDESMDLEAMKQEPQPWEFRTKPAWQRLLVMAGGVLFNFIFAILMYILVLGIWGTQYLSNSENQIWPNELAREMGFRTGDRILSMDDYVPENFNTLQADLARRDVRQVKVLRDGDTLTLYMDQAMLPAILETPGMFDVAVPFVVDTIPPQSPNWGIGLQRGDRIIALDGQPVRFVQESRDILGTRIEATVNASVLRGVDTLNVPLRTDTLGRALIYAQLPGVQIREYNALEAIPAGVKLTFTTIGSYLQDLRMVATPSTGAYKSVGSFIAIGQVFPDRWDWYAFLQLLALLSIMLGVMNLLPIPGLDGGHIVFVLYEMVTGRKPSDKFMEIAQMIGMLLLLLLMLFACGNDIGRLLH